jgi:hypothetical protein
MDKILSNKLKLKPAMKMLILNMQEGFQKKFEGYATSEQAASRFNVVLLFAESSAVLKKFANKALKSIANDGLLWIAYPKKLAKLKTDLTRDYGWEPITSKGWEIVSLVSLDDTWSALRFKRQTEIQSPIKKMSREQEIFKAVIESPENINGGYVKIPFDVEQVYGTKGQVKVKASFDGYPYRGVLANMGSGCHILIVRKDIREHIGKNVGDIVEVVLERDLEERTLDIPEDLEKALKKHKAEKLFFDKLSYTNRKEYVIWITSAKKDETRLKRLEETIHKLGAGKKNPSEK